MNITIKRITGWDAVKEPALGTIGKKFIGTSDDITTKWKMDILKSAHSPIRELKFHIRIEDIPRFVADQIVRHGKFQEMYVETARPDRGNKPRSEQAMDMLTNLIISTNAAALITMSHSRLCVGVVTKETRECMEAILQEILVVEPELYVHCVPSCVHQCGCKEFKPCGLVAEFLSGCGNLMDINQRYYTYHKNCNRAMKE